MAVGSGLCNFSDPLQGAGGSVGHNVLPSMHRNSTGPPKDEIYALLRAFFRFGSSTKMKCVTKKLVYSVSFLPLSVFLFWFILGHGLLSLK